MQLKRVILVVAAGACGAAVMVGCGSETVAGEAVVAKPTSGLSEPVFSPCDDIPDEVLRGVGLDPASASQDILGIKLPGWNACRWKGPSYSVTVAATDRTMDEFRANARNTEFVSQSIGDREAFSYRETADIRRERCDVALRSGANAVLVRFSLNTVDAESGDPCSRAVSTAGGLEPVIPR